MKRLTILLALALWGCDSGWSPPFINGGSRAIPQERAYVAPGEQFPRALYGRSTWCSWASSWHNLTPWTPVLSELMQGWFSSHLNAAGEQPLPTFAASADPGSLTIRFLWLPTFDNPVMIRVQKSASGDARIVAKRLSGKGGYDSGTVAAQIDRALTAREWQRIVRKLATSDLSSQPAGDCPQGTDGSEWIVEVLEDDGYNFLRRWSPTTGSVREVGDMLLDLTGWRFADVY